MAELLYGDWVALTAPDLLLEDGAVVFSGDKGMVIGRQGFDRVIVSFGTVPPFRTGTCRAVDVRRIPSPTIRR